MHAQQKCFICKKTVYPMEFVGAADKVCLAQRERDRQTERQTERERDRQTERQGKTE